MSELAYKDEAANAYDRAFARVSTHFLPFLLKAARLAPGQRVLDAATGTGIAAEAALAVVGPGGQVTAADSSPAMVNRARQRLAGSPNTSVVVEDCQSLGFADRSFDMVWSNLALNWLDTPQQVFAETRRVLRPGGVFMFSTLGPDTLKELRGAYAAVDRHVHVNRFVDMHDLGDGLVSARFSDPVMDMECVTLSYADVRGLLRDLKASGARNFNAGRNAALSGKGRFTLVG